MTDRPEVSAALLAAAAEDCGQPLTKDAAARLSAGERVSALAALAPSLMQSTDGGRQRLAAWTQPEGPVETPAAARRRLREEVAFYGDAIMWDVTLDVVRRLPVIVQRMIAADLVFVAGGWETHGWTSSAEFRAPDGTRRPRFVLLTGNLHDAEALERIVRHEVSHNWLRAPDGPEPQAISTVDEVALLALAAEGQWPALDARDLDERRTDLLALSWECAAWCASASERGGA